MRLSHRTLVATAGIALWACAVCVAAQDVPPVASPNVRPGTTTVVVAGQRYGAGPLRRLIFGPHWRKVWTTPVRVDVFDLGSHGGLKPTKLGGGMQTKSLRLEAPDGREFRLRLVDKNPEKVVPAEYRDTAVEQIAQDQISAGHPGGVLVVDGLSEAAGLPYVEHRLVVIPDDPRLGEFRKDFAGRLAVFEQNPDKKAPPPGFEGLTELLDTKEFLELLDKDPSQSVDAKAFAKNRLFDLVIGDWDRHELQWEWAKYGDDPVWRPVPKDRDQAFARYDGLALALVRPTFEGRLVNYTKHHAPAASMGFNSRIVDRRLLGSLGWGAWQEAAQDLQARLSDAAIDDAIRRLPPEYREVSAHDLRKRLRARRDTLMDAARDFYAMLALEVEVHGSDKADVAEVVPVNGSMEVRVSSPGPEGSSGEPYFRRVVRPGETKEVRIRLHGGDDRVVTRPGDDHGIRVRVIGGKGDDVVDNTGELDVKVYDSDGSNRVVGTVHAFDDAKFEEPLDASNRPLRDWGSIRTAPSAYVRAGGDLGVFLGARVAVTQYAFRKYPYHYRHSFEAGYATGLPGARVEYSGAYHLPDSARRTNLLARFSQMELVRFHGFGNETVALQPGEFYRVPQNEYLASVQHQLKVPWVDLSVGPIVKYTTTEMKPDRFITQARPYGSEGFGQAGLAATLRLDGRDNKGATQKGALLELGGSWYPRLWSVRQAFGEAHGEVATFVPAPLPLRPTLALRAGGKRVWGQYPFHEAAFIGGPDSLRGFRRQRFAGDAAVYGTAELHVPLVTIRVLVPVQWGVFGLVDTGRVFLEGESSRTWHTGVGGGLWWSFLKPANTISLAVVRGNEGRNRIYLQSGFGF